MIDKTKLRIISSLTTPATLIFEDYIRNNFIIGYPDGTHFRDYINNNSIIDYVKYTDCKNCIKNNVVID